MSKDMGAETGSQATPEAPAGLRPAGFDPARKVRRTISSFDTAPRDGTPFHILNTIRFNPAAMRFEALYYFEDDKIRWGFIDFGEHEPTMWLREVPLPYKIPARKIFAYTLTYTLRVETRRKKFADWLWAKLPKSVQHLADIQRTTLNAIATEARRAETENTGSVHEGAGRQASPKTSRETQP